MSKVKIVGLRTIYVGAKGRSGKVETEEIAPGNQVSLDKAEAERLIELGHARLPISETSELGTEPEGSVKPKTASDVEAAIRAVIPDLNPDEDFTKADVPSVAALEKSLGWDVTVAERDAAWEAHTAAGGIQGELT